MNLVKNQTKQLHTNMVVALAKNNQDIITGISREEGVAHSLHMAVGISGEVGELLENLVDNLGRENLVEELGDIEFYMRGLADEVGYNSLMLSHHCQPQSANRQASLSCGMYASIKAAALLDAVKKYAIYEKPIDMDIVREAFAGLLYTLEGIRSIHGITRQECLEHNLNKLSKRYPAGSYSNQQAQTRADKKEGEL